MPTLKLLCALSVLAASGLAHAQSGSCIDAAGNVVSWSRSQISSSASLNGSGGNGANAGTTASGATIITAMATNTTIRRGDQRESFSGPIFVSLGTPLRWSTSYETVRADQGDTCE